METSADLAIFSARKSGSIQKIQMVKMYCFFVELPPNKIGHKEITKKGLIDALMNTNHGRDDGRMTLSKMLVRAVRKLASNLGINTSKLVTHPMQPGWVGKGKGLLQVLWERV